MTVPCPYCMTDVRVTWWYNLVGFATRCPTCMNWSGPRWPIKRLLIAIFASLFLNALVLFFVARPLRALILIAMYVATVFTLLAAGTKYANDALISTAYIAIFLGPAVLAITQYFVHEAEVGRPQRVYVDIDTLPAETARNEAEIGIYHRVQYLSELAKGSYFFAVLDAIRLMLDKRWVELIVPLIVIGLAYTAQQHESRSFAIAYALLGGGVLAVRVAHGSETWMDAVGYLSLGVLMSLVTISLFRWRRYRETIPLPPAEHLK